MHVTAFHLFILRRPVLSPRHRRETGRSCLHQVPSGHPCPSRTHARGLATPGNMGSHAKTEANSAQMAYFSGVL